MTRALELAARPVIYNVPLLEANTEFSQVLPSGTRKFTIQCRNPDVDVRLAFITGTIDTLFVTIPAGGAYNEDLIHVPDDFILTLFFQTNDQFAPIMEIICWSIDPTGNDL